MLGPQKGMGPVWLQNNGLKKCDEFHIPPCDESVEQCCAVVPCTLCLKWEVYGEDDKGGIARYNAGHWTGAIAGAQFDAYWQRNYGTNKCEFVVTLDGAVILTTICGGAYSASCRDPSGSVDTVIGGDHGKLTWEVLEKRPLQYNKENCTDFFCGTCECTCRKLCVAVRIKLNDYTVFYLDGSDVIGTPGTLVSDCDAPKWAGSVLATLGSLSESVAVEFYLYRDAYTGDCWIGGSARGEDLIPQKVYDCTSLIMTFELSDGSTINIKCYECECNNPVCEFCCLPLDYSDPNYPAGFYADIPFSFSGCDHDISDTFATASNLPCTRNVVYYGPTWSLPSQTMYTDTVAADGSCGTTPCTQTFGLMLQCTASESETGCDQIVLWIGSLYKLVGDDGTKPPGALEGLDSWIKISPTSCSCDDVQGVAAIFEFDIEIDCSDKTFGNPYGPCFDKLIGCCEYSCSGVLAI